MGVIQLASHLRCALSSKVYQAWLGSNCQHVTKEVVMCQMWQEGRRAKDT